MKLRPCLIALGMVVVVSAVQAQSAQMAFVTDRTTTGDLDLWKMREDGTYPTEVTDESGDVHNPSIVPGGTRVVYENGVDLYLANVNGSGTPINLTGSGSGVCNQYSTDDCWNPDVGPLVFGGQGDFRIVFSRTYPYAGVNRTEIWMATMDVSENTLGNFVQLVANNNGSLDPYNPAWCGATHIVYDVPESANSLGPRKICILEVGTNGPGYSACYFNDGNIDDQPSCNSQGTQVVWARKGYGGNDRDIFIMDCAGLECDDAGALDLMYNDTQPFNDFHPVFAPSSNQVAFVSDRAKEQDSNDDDLDVWTMHSDGTHKTIRTPDYPDKNEDNDPDWGPAGL